MTKRLKKGNVDDLKTANNERIKITLLRKDFSKEILNRIKLEDSVISKCVFKEASFYGNEYYRCEFISCDFTKANLTNVKFIECKFHESKFVSCNLEEIEFNNCKILNCSFKDTDLSANVVGLSEKDVKVISEENDEIDYSKIMEMGFSQIRNDDYVIKAGNDYCEISISKDEEMGDNIWRITFFCKDESLLSDTIEIFNEPDLPEISRNVKSILIEVKKKLEIGKYNEFLSEEDVKNCLVGLDEIKGKFKQIYNTEE